MRHSFRNWAGSFDVLSELWVDRDALRARFWLENTPPPKPWFALYLEGVSAGSWSERAVRVYGGPGNVIQDPQAFRLGYDGHNLASSFAGFDFANGQSLVQNSNAIPDYLEVTPEQRIYTLVTPHEQTLEFFPANNVFAAVKRIREQDTRTPSAGVPKLAGRFVFDLWSGRYGESARDLDRPPNTESRTRWWSGTTGSAGATTTAFPTSILPIRSSGRSTIFVRWRLRASGKARSSRRTTTTSISIPTRRASRTTASCCLRERNVTSG